MNGWDEAYFGLLGFLAGVIVVMVGSIGGWWAV
jgi:hypothetical protein